MPPDTQKKKVMSINHDVDDSSDGPQSDVDDTNDDDSWSPLNSIVKRKTFELGLRGSYTDWSPQEAFRELVQNWRDAIIESNDISPADFCIHREEASAGRATEIVFNAFERGADRRKVDQCLGFIRFNGRNGAGTVEITNRKATLQPWHLQIGGTSKRGGEDQAGAHGEGLKLAALVFMRSTKNNHLRCQSTGFNWNFNFKNECLVVTVHRIDMARQEARQPRKSAPQIATPTVVAHRDVQFILGEDWKGRDEKGNEIKRVPVQQRDFEEWTKVALSLTKAKNGDAGIISTVHGDLITAGVACGNLYLKDLLLREQTQDQSASISGHSLKFGYNFANGKTDRERQSLRNASQESRAICGIWNEALKARPDLAQVLSDLLNIDDPVYAEVACAKKFWPKETAQHLQKYLFSEKSAGRWYYCVEEMNKNPKLMQVIEGLGREPFELTKKYWDILEQYNLVFTAEKEALRRFATADPVPVPRTSFAISMNRLLRACIRACSQTRNMSFEFVAAGDIQLNIAISEDNSVIRIHERWVSMKDALTQLGSIVDMEEGELVDYTVKRLFTDILEKLPRVNFLQEGNAAPPDECMKQEAHRAELRLIQHQRMQIRIIDKTDDGRPGLCVEWAVNARPQHDNARIEVQCHRASRCSLLRDSLLIASDAKQQNTDCLLEEDGPGPETQEGELQQPTCRVCRVPFGQGTHCESDLEEGEEYFFVLVTPTDPNSFVSVSDNMRTIAPSTIRPNSPVSASAQPGNHNGTSQPLADDNDSEGESGVLVGDGHSPKPVDGIPPPGHSYDAAGGSGAASGISNEPTELFRRGPRLNDLNLLAIDTSRMYDAGNSKYGRAFMGYLKDEPSHPEESRKRRRMD